MTEPENEFGIELYRPTKTDMVIHGFVKWILIPALIGIHILGFIKALQKGLMLHG